MLSQRAPICSLFPLHSHTICQAENYSWSLWPTKQASLSSPCIVWRESQRAVGKWKLIQLLDTSGKGNRAVLDTQGTLPVSIPLVYRSHCPALFTVVSECFLLAQQLNSCLFLKGLFYVCLGFSKSFPMGLLCDAAFCTRSRTHWAVGEGADKEMHLPVRYNLVPGEVPFAFLGICSKSCLCRNALQKYSQVLSSVSQRNSIKWMSGRGQSCASCGGPQSQEMASFPKLDFPKGDKLEVCPFASWVIHKPVFTGAFSSILLQEGGNHSYNFRKKVSENDYKKWKHFF